MKHSVIINMSGVEKDHVAAPNVSLITAILVSDMVLECLRIER